MKLTFKLISGQEIEHDIQKDSIVIGRSPHCDIVVPFEGFSRKHCKIEINNETQVFITDLDSANGVSIDGAKIPPETRVEFNLLLPLVIGPAEVMIELDPLPEVNYKNVGSIGAQKANPAPISRASAPFPTGKTVKAKDKKKNYTSVIAGALLIIGFFVFQEVKRYFDGGESESDEISRLEFESQMNSRKNDGTVKTKDF